MRDELARRYRDAQFHAQAQAAEMQAQEQQIEDAQQPDSGPAAPMAQIMGVQRQKDIGSGMADNDRLRRWAGL